MESFGTYSFTCKCAEDVKRKKTASGNSLFTGFALITDYGKSWFCYGRTAAQIARNKGVDEDRGCSNTDILTICEKEDNPCTGVNGASPYGSEFVYEFKEEKEIDRMYLL